MTNGSIATRYATALFEEAKAQFVEKEIYEHLSMLFSSMKAEPELQFALTNPRISRPEKYQLLITASGIDPESETLYTRFLEVVLEHGREAYLRLMILVYQDLVREEHNISRVIFETAVPASDAVIEKMKQRVSARTGHEVECVTRVRPSLIGGFRLRVGDIRYDYSYATKLENIKKRFLCQNN